MKLELPVTTMSVLTPDGRTVTAIPSAQANDILITGLKGKKEIKLESADIWAVRQILKTIFSD